MSVDWTPVVTAGVSALALVIPAAAVAAAAWFRARGDRLAANAVQTGAGIAYNSLVAATRGGGAVNWQAAKAVAVTEGVEAAQAVMTSINPDTAHTKVDGALGHLLAADPTVSAGGGSSATASAGPGETATATAGDPTTH